MQKKSIDIIPSRPSFYGSAERLDLKAISVFCALGFFLDDDTYYLGQKVLKPATDYTFDGNGNISSAKSYFNWHYNPKISSLKVATSRFTELFEDIIKEQVKDQQVILPLSGGLDSRTQAAALKYLGANVNSYGYQFKNGHNETVYSKKIAEVCSFPFQNWEVPKGYLWTKIDELSKINKCYSDFTHPRQMAFSGRYKQLGNIFSLGHWGDVLFDNAGVDKNLSLEQQVDYIFKSVVKPEGLNLASDLWKHWGIKGSFRGYLYERLKNLVLKIDIQNNANARIRAFKSLYWAPRWTSVNLSVFENERPISLPYYNNKMCEFICEVSEDLLAKRQIQIEYLKLRSPELAKITWQDHRPFNLYNYHLNYSPINIPYRAYHKLKRTVFEKPIIKRNWELQFIGAENAEHLEKRLFKTKELTEKISTQLINDYYLKFKSNPNKTYAHAVSMLLTLSSFFKDYGSGK